MLRALLFFALLAAPAAAQTCVTETFQDACEGEWCGWATNFESDHSALRSALGKGDASAVTYGPLPDERYQFGVETEWLGAGGGHTSLSAEFIATGLAGEEPHYWQLTLSAPICPPDDPTYPNCRGGCAQGPPPYTSDSLRGFFIGNVGVVTGALWAIGEPSPVEFPPLPFSALAIAVRNPDRSLRIVSPRLMYPPIAFGETVRVTIEAVDNGDGTHDVDVSATYGGETRTALGVVEGVDLTSSPKYALYTMDPSACTTAGKYPFGAGRTERVARVEACK